MNLIMYGFHCEMLLRDSASDGVCRIYHFTKIVDGGVVFDNEILNDVDEFIGIYYNPKDRHNMVQHYDCTAVYFINGVFYNDSFEICELSDGMSAVFKRIIDDI